MFNRKSSVIVLVAAVLALTSAASGAWNPVTRPNRLTFSRPVALPGVVLPAGAYVFELGPAGTHRDVVRVTTPKGASIYMGFTRPVAKPRTLPKTLMVTFGESVTNEPAPISVWYPIDGPDGREFVYE